MSTLNFVPVLFHADNDSNNSDDDKIAALKFDLIEVTYNGQLHCLGSALKFRKRKKKSICEFSQK